MLTETEARVIRVEINCKGQRNSLLGFFYRYVLSDKNSLVELISTIKQLTSKPYCNIFNGGEFTYPGWNWGAMKLKNNYTQMSNYIKNSATSCVSTSWSMGSQNLKITNVPSRVVRTVITPRISDHDISMVDMSLITTQKYQVPQSIKLYNRTNWMRLNPHREPIMTEIVNN